MKTTKIVLLGFLAIMTLFAAVSCTEQTILDQFLKAANQMETTSVVYTSDSLTEEDGVSSAVSYKEDGTSIITLSETTNDLITFNELRLDILDLHDQIVLQREGIRALTESIREEINTLKDAGYVLLEDDRATLQTAIDNLTELKNLLLATQGEAYQRIYDLRGSYTRENLPQIITVYTEVIEVLQYRYELLQSATEILQNAELLIGDYLEN
ncbi:MAG: hypothetical protein JXB08_03115 [Bacilli bacterium]|nr:hypothetical protein [Bacilli bacterium]MBN2876076.1 hypothetical protein [Bacilli bacterium]